MKGTKHKEYGMKFLWELVEKKKNNNNNKQTNKHENTVLMEAICDMWKAGVPVSVI